MKDYKVLVEALRCSASGKSKCKEDCPYRVMEEIKPDFPMKPDVTVDGIWYRVSCDCDRIAMDAAWAIEKLCEGCEEAGSEGMTYEEALQYAKSYMLVNGVPIDARETTKCIVVALEKQIPKKPVRLAGNILFACPNDRWHQMTVDNRNKFPCCPICGQALDWSDAE